MASIFEQYEQHTARASSSIPQVARESSMGVPPISSGYVTASMEEDVCIFSKQRINFTPSQFFRIQPRVLLDARRCTKDRLHLNTVVRTSVFRPPKPITHLVANNNILMMAMSDNTILRIDLEHPDQPDEVRVGEERIHKLFLDPTGRHLIISTESQEVLYLSRNGRKPKQLQKLKGHLISALGWNKANASETTTGEILMGTTRGLIFETEIQAGDDSRFFQHSLDQYWKQVFNLGKEGAVAVTGIEVERIPAASPSERRFFVMATTPASFLELPGDFGYSQVEFYYSKYRAPPANFAWMTGPGVYYGNFDFTSKSKNNLTTESRLLPYPIGESEAIQNPRPLSIVSTEFHVLLLFQDRMKVMCVLNEQLVDEEVFQSRFGRLLGLTKDHIKKTIWCYTEQSVFRYKVNKESRDVWRMYLDKGDFDKAKDYCQDNPANLDQVLTRQAQHFFDTQVYEKSAVYFAMTEKSFEEVALKFIEAKQTSALKMFLSKKLGALKSQEKTQMTMLVIWLIELYLNQLGELRPQQEAKAAYDSLHDEFQKFLAQKSVKECLASNVNAVYDLIASHGGVEDMVYFAMLMKDYERVISHHIQHEGYSNALDVLRKPRNVELFYKFSPVLMQHIPQGLCQAWIELGRDLDPKRLIPALVQLDHSPEKNQVNKAIRYLEFCVMQLSNTEKAIHNYLLSLYAKHKPEQLMGYLEQQGDIAENVHCDLKYALRLCAEHDHKRACVHIYTTIGLFEEAVDLALQVDVELAKLSAEKPEEDEELKKKLWLRIAKHVVQKQSDIQQAMGVLKECPALKIEDILPFFPDFVTIDHFKDAICSSLTEYNQHIESLKTEMEDATESAKAIRSDIQEMRNKYGIVGGQQKCATCSYPLLTRSFYLFPCQHMFHSDCLIAEVQPHLTQAKQKQMTELQQKLNQLSLQRQPSLSSSDAVSKRDEQEQMRNDLDDIIAAECVYCGEIMIKSIDMPFITTEEYESVIQSWD